MNCLKRLPWSAGAYNETRKYYPQDRVYCEGSFYVSLAEQSGNKPSFTVNPDGTYTVTDGWMLLAAGQVDLGLGYDYELLERLPSISGVKLVGDKTPKDLGIYSAEEADDLFQTKEAARKESEDVALNLDAKVDKVDGKGLSTNDYTDADKAKVAAALQSYTETDPTVPEWAKRPTKPKYTAAEVGALPEGTKIPSKTSELSNDSGFLTQHQKIKTVNGQSLIGEGDITIEGGSGSSVTVDSALSDSSANPVENKAVKKAIDAKQDKGDYALKSEIPDVSGLAQKTDIPDISGKADKSEIPDVSGFATKAEVSRVEGQAATNAADLLNKVDKVDGKGLSANDYTDADKAKVAAALTAHQSLEGYARTAEVMEMIAAAVTAAINTEI